MNTTASFSSEPSWSRRCSTETIFSIQGKETDFVRDTSDTEWFSSDGDAAVEYEPATEPEDDGPLSGDSSGHSDDEIIKTKVIEVSVGDDGELQLADSELTASSSDSEMDLHDYWLCAHCRAKNNNPRYRYCEKCFKERKNFFPPRPKRNRKRLRSTRIEPETIPRTLSQDSGVESAANSQELSQNDLGQCSQNSLVSIVDNCSQASLPENSSTKTYFKRRSQMSGRYTKRIRKTSTDSESDTDLDIREANKPKGGNHVAARVETVSDPGSLSNVSTKGTERSIESRVRTDVTLAKTVSDTETDIASVRGKPAAVAPLAKMVSDPALTIRESADGERMQTSGLCIVCAEAPKSGVFVHGRVAHICCCYKCAVKVWSRAKRCPVCNCKVSNVLKAVVM